MAAGLWSVARAVTAATARNTTCVVGPLAEAVAKELSLTGAEKKNIQENLEDCPKFSNFVLYYYNQT